MAKENMSEIMANTKAMFSKDNVEKSQENFDDSMITFRQLRVCIMAATEKLKGLETGSTDTERLEQLCNHYDADYNILMHDLVGQIETFGRFLLDGRS